MPAAVTVAAAMVSRSVVGARRMAACSGVDDLRNRPGRDCYGGESYSQPGDDFAHTEQTYQQKFINPAPKCDAVEVDRS
jgi:hypothetical protein